MNTKLVVAENIKTAVVPKPTKAEVVSAMVQLKMEELRSKAKEAQGLRDSLIKEIEAEAMAFFLKNPTAHGHDIRCGYQKSRYDHTTGKSEMLNEWRGFEINFDVENLPKAIVKKLIRAAELDKKTKVPQEKRIREMVRDGLGMMVNTEKRVQALCDSPACRADLQKMLKHIGV